MDDYYGVVVDGGHVLDQRIAAAPKRQVVAIAFVGINCNISLTGVGIHKDKSYRGLACERVDLVVGVVVGDGLYHAVAVCDDFVLNGCFGGNQKGEIGGSAAPTHTESAVVAATVGAAVWPEVIIAGVISKDSCKSLSCCRERKGTVVVLEQNSTCCSLSANLGGMVLLYIDVGVDQDLVGTCVEMLWAVTVECPGVEVDWDLIFVTTDIVPCCDDAGRHVVDAPFGDCAVQDCNGEIGAPI